MSDFSLPQLVAALSQLTFLAARIADWSDRGALVEQFRAGVANGQALLSPFALLALPSTRTEQRQCAQTGCLLAVLCVLAIV